MARPLDACYETMDEAAIAGLDYIFPASRAAGIEYALGIYEDPTNLLYGFTHPATDGKPASVALIAGAGSGFVAFGHTHPHKPPEGYLPHHISNHKTTHRGVPAYWIAPNGTVHVYEPSLGKRRMVRVHRNKPKIVR